MKKVLIVDDDPMVRQLTRMALAEQYVCLEAADAENAYALLDHEHPDLILLDWVLPGLSGPNFFKRLQRDRALAKIPVIIVSARGEDQLKKTVRELGAAAHLSKPFNVKTLRELVARVIEQET
ncbi:MAG: response regulator [Anaerolineae bacterium]|nr:response regulator [Anaerolineae bacterium]